MKKWMIASVGLLAMGVASARLPPLSDEAKAKAAEAKDKAAWADKVASYQLCVRQNQVAEYYRKTKGAEGQPATVMPADSAKAATPASGTPTVAVPPIPPCQDPGLYVATKEAAKVGNADSLPVPAAGKTPAPGEPKK